MTDADAAGNWFDNSAAMHRYFERTARAVGIVAEATLGQAQRDAPVLKGTLRGSGTVLDGPDAVLTGGVPTVIEKTVAFPIEYAAVQEMREDYNHEHGKAHFLGDSVKGHAVPLRDAVAAVGRGEDPGLPASG